jgi:hypothetical protein
MSEKQIIIPTLGLHQGRPKHRVPFKQVGSNIWEIGLSDCRNVSLSRKQGAIAKAKGLSNFTASATGATDSVRGIGVLNKYAREEEYQSSSTIINAVDASGDDAQASVTSTYATNDTILKAGKGAATTALSIGGVVTTDDCYTDDASFWTTQTWHYFGGSYSAGFRFPNATVAQGATIASAYLWLMRRSASGTLAGTIYGEDADNNNTFSNLTDFDGRTRTTANTNLNTYTYSHGTWFYWDVTTIVQEIVDRGSFSSGNAITILIDNAAGGHWWVYSVDHFPQYAPTLKINVGSQVSYDAGVAVDGITGPSQGDTIYSARIKMKLDSHNGTPNIRIYGHDADTAWRDTGTHDGGNNEATVMTDSTASWTVDALIGRTIKNVTDVSTGTITDNDATTVTVAALSGGTDDDWDTNDKYEIYEPTVRTIWDGMMAHKTTAYVDWSPNTEEIGVGEWFRSPDITTIVQEIVDRAGWDEATMAFFLEDNSSSDSNTLNFRSYDYSGNADGPSLELVTSASHYTSPTYFMYVNGATEGEIWKLNENLVPADVSQVAEAYANAYQNQIAKFMQFGDDLIFTDDGKSDPQTWDVSAGPSLFVDLVGTVKGRYWNNFKSRAWLWYVVYGSVVYPSQGLYSAVNDATSWTTTDNIILPGADVITYAINLTQDDQIIFKESSCHRLVDRQTAASDFQPYTVSPIDGSLGANIISDGARLYGLNERGIFQWPVSGYPNGFRYIHKPLQAEFDKLTLTKMRLVWFAHWPQRSSILMSYPDTESSYNNLCGVYNYEQDKWDNISEAWAANVMDNCFNLSGAPIMLLGKEDGHLKYINGDDHTGNDLSAYLDTGAVYRYDKDNKLVSRRLISIEPDTNYDGSMTLQFYVKGYDRPDEEGDNSWQGPYTHDTTTPGNKEFVPIAHDREYNYHMIKVMGLLKDEAFEVYALGLNFAPGSRTQG